MSFLQLPVLREDGQRHPLVLVDVGASGGADPRWVEAAPNLRVIGFDADKRASAGDGAMTYLSTAVYREKSRLTFHLTSKQETSSIFEPNRAFLNRFPDAERFNIVDAASLDADTLDAQLAGAGVTAVDFLQIDAQGCELAILEGAASTLRRSILGLQLEVEFGEVYRGQPLFADVDAFVRPLGFALFDLCPVHWKRRAGIGLGGPKGQLIYADALYLRDLESLSALVAGLGGDEARRTTILHALAISWLYGYLDYAQEIVDAHARLFTPAEVDALRRGLMVSPEWSARIPDFPGRATVARALGWLHRVLYRAERGWVTGGPRLGNR